MKTQSDIYFYANKEKHGYVWQHKKLNHLRYGIQNPLTVIPSFLHLYMFDRNSDILSLYLVSDYTGFFVTVHGSRFVRNREWKAARRNDASYRSFRGPAWGRKISSQRCSGRRKADRPAKLGTTTASSTGSYNDLKILPSTLPPSFHSPTSVPLALAREHPSFFLFSHLLLA